MNTIIIVFFEQPYFRLDFNLESGYLACQCCSN